MSKHIKHIKGTSYNFRTNTLTCEDGRVVSGFTGALDQQENEVAAFVSPYPSKVRVSIVSNPKGGFAIMQADLDHNDEAAYTYEIKAG